MHESWMATGGDCLETIRELEVRLGASEPSQQVGLALALGAAQLAQFALSGLAEQVDALDAEVEAVEVSRRAVRPILEIGLQRRIDSEDEACRGACLCVKCGERAVSQGRRKRSWMSMVGELNLRRRYVLCGRCKQGWAPSQRALALPDSDFTARLEEVGTMLATTVPHGMARALASKVCGVEVSTKALEDMTQRRASICQAEDESEALACVPFDKKGLPRSGVACPADTVSKGPTVAYLEVDGVIPITREALSNSELTADDHERLRKAKQEKARGGKGRRYRIVGREVKNAVLYDGKDCVQESPGRGCLLDKRYVSRLGDWQSFALRTWAEMRRQRFDEAELLVLLSDGADWIRSFAQWLPVPVMLILDLYHAKHRIWEVANVLYGERTPKARQWAQAQCERVEAGNARDVVRVLRLLRPKSSRARSRVDALATYFKNNLDRMDYPEYRRRGLRIGSGAVESANFHVTGARLKLQGMRWSAQGAADMALLRADLFNGRWETRTRRLLAA
ncbi:MAG: ISKra4 family transposase [Deltaproteobacteria bacterium]|nr:ISKra4 family transposase [Deltaproteobacteria bacterium]